MQPIDRGGRGLSVGRCGQTHGALISALQKYIRRCETDKAVRVAVELQRFAEIKSGDPIRSNMINRLAIIAMEDVGPANPALLVWVAERRAEWKLWRDDAPRSVPILLGIVVALAASPKSRVVSHARAAYAFNSPESEDVAALVGVARPAEAKNIENVVIGENAEISKLIGNLRAALAAASLDAVYWAGRLENRTLATPVNKSRKGAAAIWAEIRSAAGSGLRSAVEALYEWYRDLAGCREEHCFATCAILLLCFKSSTPAAVTRPYSLRGAPSPAEIRALFDDCPRLDLDAYCLDKHTAEGRREGKDVAHFATEGALVRNQADWAFNLRWYDAYMELRVGVAESAMFADPVRCQLVTAMHKTCTYLATLTAVGAARLGPPGAFPGRVFVKGPWPRAAARAQVAIDRLKARLSGVRPVGYAVVRARPDLFPDTPLGRRRVAMCVTRHARVEPAYFLVSPDLFHPGGAPGVAAATAPLPVKIHSSKLWAPTPIYDSAADATARAAHADLAAPTPRQGVALALRYALGVGDTCGRNFLVEQGGYVHNLDEEKILGEYAPVRFGATKKAAILAAIGKFWPEVLKTVQKWPNDLRATAAQPMLGKVRDFVAGRVAALTAAGPAALYA